MSRLDSHIYDVQNLINSVASFLEGFSDGAESDEERDALQDAIAELNDAESLLGVIEGDGDEMERELEQMEEGIDPSDALYTIERIENNIDELKRDLGSF